MKGRREIDIKWMPYKDYIFQKKWYEVLEQEWCQTGGQGYEKAGIRTENYDLKQKLRSGSWKHQE